MDHMTRPGRGGSRTRARSHARSRWRHRVVPAVPAILGSRLRAQSAAMTQRAPAAAGARAVRNARLHAPPRLAALRPVMQTAEWLYGAAPPRAIAAVGTPFHESPHMLLQIPDAMLPLLTAGAVGLLLGAGLCAVWLRRRGVAHRLVAPRDVVSPARPQIADLLLVDDSAVARVKLRRLFEKAGYEVRLAHDGLEALAELEKGRFGLMITDLEMPNLDGAALIEACRSQPQTARMPILAITGHENLRVKFNQCGDISGVHRKPWVDDILLSHVATLVGMRGVGLSASAGAALVRAARNTSAASPDRRPVARDTATS
jgi:CheY-like chemotaxis protein